MLRAEGQQRDGDRDDHDASRVLKRCSNRERLCKTLHLKQSGNAEITFCLETSGAHVSRRQGEELIRSGLFVPAGDGFFESGLSREDASRRAQYWRGTAPLCGGGTGEARRARLGYADRPSLDGRA
jgi:hypothetical protein